MEYDLTEEAAEDIRDIICYTLRTWGRDQVERYRQALNGCLDRLVSAEVVLRSSLSSLPDIYHFRCQHHLIFYTRSNHE